MLGSSIVDGKLAMESSSKEIMSTTHSVGGGDGDGG